MESNIKTPSQENLDYQRAIEVMSEAKLNVLGEMAIEEAENITFDSGVASPTLAVAAADAITKQAAIPSEAEDYLAGGVAAQAQNYLKDRDERAKESAKAQALARKHGLSHVIGVYGKADFSKFKREYKPEGRSDLLD